MNKLDEQLKNTVRSITEPCDECEGRCKFEKTPYHEAFICDDCNGKGWCPKLEYNCEVISDNGDIRTILSKHSSVEEDEIGRKNAFTSSEIYGYRTEDVSKLENLGKPLELREILFAVQLNKKYADIKDINIGELSVRVPTEKFIHIPLDIPPAEYPDKIKKGIIKLLKK